MTDTTTTTIWQRLAAVQAELHVPKGQYNSFAKYNYRSAEDIIEAAKPILQQHGLVLLLTDKIEHVGGHNYVVATASIHDERSSISIVTSAAAREEEDKKGMDASQMTGTASSYARKYALNGLFALDDAKDADTDEHTRTRQDAPVSTQNAPQREIPSDRGQDKGSFTVVGQGRSQPNGQPRPLSSINGQGNPPSDKQLNYLKSLAKEHGFKTDDGHYDEGLLVFALDTEGVPIPEFTPFEEWISSRDASTIIDNLKAGTLKP